jgi:hypothetical protein
MYDCILEFHELSGVVDIREKDIDAASYEVHPDIVINCMNGKHNDLNSRVHGSDPGDNRLALKTEVRRVHKEGVDHVRMLG